MCIEICQGLELENSDCLNTLAAPGLALSEDRLQYGSSSKLADAQLKWARTGRKLVMVTATAAGLAGLATVGAMAPASAESPPPGHLDFSNGSDSTTTSTSTPALVESDFPGLYDASSWSGSAPANASTPALAETESSDGECVDEGGELPAWGVNPATNEGCWVDGFDISACEESGTDLFACRDGLVYDSNGNRAGSDDSDSVSGADVTAYSGAASESAPTVTPGAYEELRAINHQYEEITQVQEGASSIPTEPTQVQTVGDKCGAHGGSESWRSDGTSSCVVCMDNIVAQDFGGSRDEFAGDTSIMQCTFIDPTTGDPIGRPGPDKPDTTPSVQDSDPSLGFLDETGPRKPIVTREEVHSVSSTPISVTAPDGTTVEFDRSDVLVKPANEARGSGLYVADNYHGTVITAKPGKLPVCVEGLTSDTDGDGQGYENGAACNAGNAVETASQLTGFVPSVAAATKTPHDNSHGDRPEQLAVGFRPTPAAKGEDSGQPGFSPWIKLNSSGITDFSYDENGKPFCEPHMSRDLSVCDMNLRGQQATARTLDSEPSAFPSRFDTDKSDSAVAGPKDPGATIDLSGLVGLSVDDAAAVALEDDMAVRVTKRDGKLVPATKDYRYNRVNVSVSNGVIDGTLGIG